MKKLIPLIGIICFCQVSFAIPQYQPEKVDTFFNNLPLRLSTFSARVVNLSNIEINWVTAETWPNISHYEIYRSTNNIEYNNIGTVQQISNAPVDLYYSFMDNISNTSSESTFYYRLKQVHYNGTMSWSFILIVKSGSNKKSELTIWPNPVKEEINFNFFNPYKENLVFQYFNGSGTLIMRDYSNADKGNCVIKSTIVSKLIPGVYTIKIFANNNNIGTKQFLKL